jgi:hypothetical protein
LGGWGCFLLDGRRWGVALLVGGVQLQGWGELAGGGRGGGRVAGMMRGRDQERVKVHRQWYFFWYFFSFFILLADNTFVVFSIFYCLLPFLLSVTIFIIVFYNYVLKKRCCM